MELDIKKGEAINVNFQNRKMRNKSRIDFTSSKEQKIYSQFENIRVSGKTGDVLFDIRSEPHIIEAIRNGEINIDKIFYPRITDKKLEQSLDEMLFLKTKGDNPEKMDIEELLDLGMINLSEIMDQAVPLKLY